MAIALETSASDQYPQKMVRFEHLPCSRFAREVQYPTNGLSLSSLNCFIWNSTKVVSAIPSIMKKLSRISFCHSGDTPSAAGPVAV